ncbi:calcium-binding protein [Heterostelium album PN500]|uniref:Calcium-binding protein n=1 Tax=Heterostelium pallidum (strain ATCC 26659 / Pp 5 / PN500) TaxID=670386 RepID=D3B3Y7_HETP5|nr:calcium-binding protein [Heterostelium album PN500]EFA84035.1 calcium-binding protein [Heterostelium album PN500]|eukprot:XP_020436152.1 calcium-binding protein [Heterostelium album PN500]
MSVFDEIDENVKKFLDRFDGNGDGEVSFDEVVNKLTAQKVKDPQGTAYKIFKQIDENGDEKITINELRMNSNKFKKNEIDQLIKKEIEFFFKNYDVDNDQVCTFEEVYNFYEKRGDKRPEARTMAIFSAFDKDKSSTITKEECNTRFLNKKFGQV